MVTKLDERRGERHPEGQDCIHRHPAGILAKRRMEVAGRGRRSSMTVYSQCWMDGGSWATDTEHSSF